MNEIQPSNIQYVLWSDDDAFYDQQILSRDDFANVIDSVKLKNGLLPYGNVVYDDGRHNMLMDMLGDTLSQHIRSKTLYTTWFIDDNNDLWCRDDTFSDGTNYYLFREFNTDNEMTKLTVKSSLVMDDVVFDSDLIMDNTSNIGDRILEILNLDKQIEEEEVQIDDDKDVTVNAFDITYMHMLTDRYFDGVFSSYDFEMDTVTNLMLKHTRQWRQWDEANSNFTKDMTDIDSMKMYLGIVEKEMKQDLCNACINKNEFEYGVLNKKMFGKEL